MPYDKGDFTQQGINGDVSALVRLNEKRVMKVVLSSDDESDNCDISGKVYDLLNGTSYDIGSGASGNIEITENGENINVAPYATATVNVSGGGDSFPHCKAHAVNNTGSELVISGVPYDTGVISYEITLQANESIDMAAFYGEEDSDICLAPIISELPLALPEGWFTNLTNLELLEVEGQNIFFAKVTDPTASSSCTVDARFFEPAQ